MIFYLLIREILYLNWCHFFMLPNNESRSIVWEFFSSYKGYKILVVMKYIPNLFWIIVGKLISQRYHINMLVPLVVTLNKIKNMLMLLSIFIWKKFFCRFLQLLFTTKHENRVKKPLILFVAEWRSFCTEKTSLIR